MKIAAKPADSPPRLLALVCLLGFVWWLYSIGGMAAIRLFGAERSGLLAGFPGVSFGPTLFQAFCLAAMAGMRRWGVIGYGAIAVLHQVIYLVQGSWVWWWMVAPLLVVAVGGLYFRRMWP